LPWKILWGCEWAKLYLGFFHTVFKLESITTEVIFSSHEDLACRVIYTPVDYINIYIYTVVPRISNIVPGTSYIVPGPSPPPKKQQTTAKEALAGPKPYSLKSKIQFNGFKEGKS